MKSARQCYELPGLVKERNLFIKLLDKVKLLELMKRWGLYEDHHEPFLRDGKINPEYADLFAKKYSAKVYYTNKQLQFLPGFCLIGKHRERRVMVLGNGPSLKKFDFSNVKNAVTIGTNTSSEFYHSDYVLISSPFAFIRAQPFFDFGRSKLLVAEGMWNGQTRKDIWNKNEEKIFPVYFDERQEWRIDDGRLIGSGPNVGLMAVDIALLMGASSILLVGCDGYKNRKLEEMYAGHCSETYRKTLLSRGRVSDYEKLLWERDEEVHEKFLMKQEYCEKKGIRFGAWGEDCNYYKLNKVPDVDLHDYC